MPLPSSAGRAVGRVELPRHRDERLHHGRPRDHQSPDIGPTRRTVIRPTELVAASAAIYLASLAYRSRDPAHRAPPSHEMDAVRAPAACGSPASLRPADQPGARPPSGGATPVR